MQLLMLLNIQLCFGAVPIVVNTWGFRHATQKAWDVLKHGQEIGADLALDALQAGCEVCQDEQCDTTVGYGGSPDENGETTLDALIFDGDKMDVGAVGGLRKIKNAILAARHVLENTEHSLLVGSLATDFAKQFGLPEESLATNYSIEMWQAWKKENCQPNFWKTVIPDPKLYCGPYKSLTLNRENEIFAGYNNYNCNNHDTIGMIVMSTSGHIVAGTSSNGAKFKIPGRVGDAPLPGAGAYADSMVGAAAATGDGDIMMRFLPSFLAVEMMRQGSLPTKAATIAISRIIKKYPNFFGAVIVINKKGDVAAACHGMKMFPYTIANEAYPKTIIKYVKCINIKS